MSTEAISKPGDRSGLMTARIFPLWVIRNLSFEADQNEIDFSLVNAGRRHGRVHPVAAKIIARVILSVKGVAACWPSPGLHDFHTISTFNLNEKHGIL
jgi:hypothetical protein